MASETDKSGEAGKPAGDLGIAHTLSEEELERQGRFTGGGRRLRPGERFANRYLIGDMLGQGGAGSVYAAIDTVFQKPVALKLIRSDRLASPEACARLLEEAALMRDIRHDNIVVVYDANLEAGQPYVTMERLEGKSLRAWMREQLAKDQDCPLETAVQIVLSILSGLEFAHGKGITHRDLKPENVFLTGIPEAAGAPLKLLDFGLALAANASRDASSSMGVGTPLYMAPEQATAPEAARAPADFFALSVMFYELLVGVPSRGQHDPISDGRPEIPKLVDDLINRGLSHDRKRRPQSCVEYRKALLTATDTPEVRRARMERELKAKGPEAMRQHAESLYKSGKAEPAELAEARRWFIASAEGGSAEASRAAGYMLMKGEGGPRDAEQARFWLGRASEAGFPTSMYNLGYLLGAGEGGPQDHAAARSWYLRAANEGSLDGMVAAARMMVEGNGGPTDHAGALAWYLRAAAAGRSDAMFDLARMLQLGMGGPADLPGARSWRLKASEAGNPEAMMALADMLEKGEGGPVDLEAAARWLVRAGTAELSKDERTDVDSRLARINGKMDTAVKSQKALKLRDDALRLFDGDKIRTDPAKARTLFMQAADLGDSMSMSNLGYMLDHGFGGPVDVAGARDWFRKAAEAGLPMGMTNYAHFLRQGRGGPKDMIAARTLYKLAIEAGDEDARKALDAMDAPPPPGPTPQELKKKADALYKQGKGTTPEIAEAVKLYVEAGNAGDIDAMNALGRMARWGEGVQRNSDSARTWFTRAAEAGDAYAQYMIGWMLKNGESNDGWKVDLKGAEMWLKRASNGGEPRATAMLGDMCQGEARYELYKQAAEAGWQGAMTKLGSLLLTGAVGVAPDKAAAKAWLEKAAKLGDPEAGRLLKERF